MYAPVPIPSGEPCTYEDRLPHVTSAVCNTLSPRLLRHVCSHGRARLGTVSQSASPRYPPSRPKFICCPSLFVVPHHASLPCRPLVVLSSYTGPQHVFMHFDGPERVWRFLPHFSISHLPLYVLLPVPIGLFGYSFFPSGLVLRVHIE